MVQNHCTREQETHMVGVKIVLLQKISIPPPPPPNPTEGNGNSEGSGGPKGGNLRGVRGGFSSLFFFRGAPSKIDEQIIVFIDDLLSMIFYLQSA